MNIKRNILLVTKITLFIGLILGVFNKKVSSQTDGCYVYEHPNFGGGNLFIPGGEGYTYLGDWWNDKITSIQIFGSYKLVVYQHSELQGESKTFYEGTRTVGDLWDNQISSLECVRR
jgi:hypothetical protein